jgi:hypothetical protein
MIVRMAAGNVTLAFGNKDFWAEVVARYQKFFTRSARLQESILRIVDPAADNAVALADEEEAAANGRADGNAIPEE